MQNMPKQSSERHFQGHFAVLIRMKRSLSLVKCPIFNPCYKFLPERVLIVWMIIEWDFIAQMDQMMKDVDW